MKELIIPLLEMDKVIQISIGELRVGRVNETYYVYQTGGQSENYQTALQAVEAFILARDLLHG